MSGLLGRLRDWLGSLFGRGAEAEVAPDADYVCGVCGTAVDDPEGGCPLCGSTDLEARDGSAAESPDGTGETDGAEPGPERRSVEGTTDDDVSRLRDVRTEGEREGGDGTPDAGAGADDGSADPGREGDGADAAADDGTADR